MPQCQLSQHLEDYKAALERLQAGADVPVTPELLLEALTAHDHVAVGITIASLLAPARQRSTFGVALKLLLAPQISFYFMGVH